MQRLKWLLSGVFLAFAIAGGLWIWFKAARPNAVGHALSAALGDILRAHPRVSVRNYVVVEEKKPIAEFALVSRQTDVERRIESVRLHSKAELVLRAAFDVKAGFDFRETRFELILDPGLKKARLDLPSPKVLSMEMIRYEVLVDRSGWWNRIPEGDRELAMRSMQADAKLEAIRAGILGDCRQALEKKTAEITRSTGVTLEFRYGKAAEGGSEPRETGAGPGILQLGER